MAKQERRSGGMGGLLLGLLVGALIVVAAYLFLTRNRQAEPVNPPVAAAPVDAPPPVAPPAAAPKAPAPAVPPSAPKAPLPADEGQIADDAAATGMTGPVNPPADQPSY